MGIFSVICLVLQTALAVLQIYLHARLEPKESLALFLVCCAVLLITDVILYRAFCRYIDKTFGSQTAFEDYLTEKFGITLTAKGLVSARKRRFELIFHNYSLPDKVYNTVKRTVSAGTLYFVLYALLFFILGRR